MIMKSPVFSAKSIIFTMIISGFYIILVIYLMNFKLVIETLTGNFPFSYKTTLLLNLLGGMWTAMTGFGLATLVTTAILTGINLTLIFQRFSLLYSLGNLHLSLGGSFLGFIGSGCAACGLPILALLGLTGSITYLPFRGTEFSLLAIALLVMALYLMLKSNNQKMACRLDIGAAR